MNCGPLTDDTFARALTAAGFASALAMPGLHPVLDCEAHLRERRPSLLLEGAVHSTDPHEPMLAARAVAPSGWCEGHFPSAPCLPLAVMAMAMSQAAALLSALVRGLRSGEAYVTLSADGVRGLRLALLSANPKFAVVCKAQPSGRRRVARVFACAAVAGSGDVLATIDALHIVRLPLPKEMQ